MSALSDQTLAQRIDATCKAALIAFAIVSFAIWMPA